MSLTKKDLGQIKGAVKETVSDAMKSEPIKKLLKETVAEVMESKPIKKLLKETVLDAMEPMMVANQNEFTKIDERFEKIDERFDNLEATLKNQYPNKDYLTEKLGDLAADIGARIDRKKEQKEKFKRKIIEIFERGHLANKEEILYLEKLI